MMYILLILFFVSLIGIIIMVGRKLALIKNGRVVGIYHPHPFTIDFDKVKHLAFKNSKKFAYMLIFVTLKFYIRSSNFLKNKYNEIKIKIEDMNKKNNINGNASEKVEVNKFLKMISDYKHKIREIKHKIHEEEKNL